MKTIDGYTVDRVLFDHSPLTADEGNPFLLSGTMAAKVAEVVVVNPNVKQGAAYRIGGLTVGAGESANGSLCLPWYNAPRYEFGFKFKLPHPDADILSFNFNLDFEDGVNNRRFRFVLDSNYGVDNTYQYFSSVGIMTDIPTFASLWRKQELWYQLRVVADFSVNTWKVIELNDLRLVGSALNTVGGGTLPYINISLVVDIAAITTVHFYLDRFYCYALR